jgi:hypothetical protein
VARTPPPAPEPKRRFGRKAKAAPAEDKGPGVIANVKAAYGVLRKHEPRALWLALAIVVVVIGAFVGIGFATGHVIILPILGVLVGVVGALNLLGWRAQKAVLDDAADKRGVALEVIRRMRGDWKITEAVQFTRNQDFVHRVVGRPGIVLIAEGRPQAARELLRTESRRARRVAPDVAVHEIVIGPREDEVPLAKLTNRLTKLPRTLKPAEVRSLDIKLKAVAGTSLPLPKGPMPTRMPRGKIR